MFKVIKENGQQCPVIICDHCHKQIATDGLYWWQVDDLEKKNPITGTIYTTHSYCGELFKKGSLSNFKWLHSGLDDLLALIVLNTHVDIDDAKRKYESPNEE